ncbi:MAG: hypothetical protein FJX52_16100 [Alphaproteobacteria bacterium]|nr:hypothetical protein [Alphaproteobacteria bacterium]
MDQHCTVLIAHQAQVLDPPGEPTTLVLSGAEGELVRLILGPADAMALASDLLLSARARMGRAASLA